MISFAIRRLLYMLPTVFGVILITFVLFNAVGGSPAAVALGKNASPRALEEFDEQRGFNKPLLAGFWTGTRAMQVLDFSGGAGTWSGVSGIEDVRVGGGEGYVRVAGPGRYRLPLAFPLREGTTYRLRVVCRSAGGAGLSVAGVDACEGGGWGRVRSGWSRHDLRFQAVAGAVPELEVSQGGVDVRSIRLERRVRHVFDSQLLHFLGRILRWDLGESISTNQKVTAMLRRGVGPSLMLTVPIFAGELVISLSLALVCAYFRDRWPDRSLVFLSVTLMSVNYLIWIIFGQFFLAYKMEWFPIWGMESWANLLLPVCIGIVSSMGANLRFYRTIMLDEMYKDYVRTAFAKGRSPAGVLFGHVLPNAMIPVITNTVIALPFLYTGSLLLESFFGIPGLGGMSINAINSSDVEVVRGVVLVGALLYVAASLVSDLCYAVVDPRVKLR